MNRLVIVGNGFDLAHGLPTGYCDFIDWYWRDVCKKIKSSKGAEYEDENIHVILDLYPLDYNMIELSKLFSQITTYNGLKGFFTDYSDYFDAIRKRHGLSDNYSFKIKNSFLELINDCHQIQNWVDIENEYYKLLKDCLKEKDNSKVTKLNEEFECVKQLLEKYLCEMSLDYNLRKVNSIELLNHFAVRETKLQNNDPYLQEFPEILHTKLIAHNIEVLRYSGQLQHRIWDGAIKENNLFVDFNYTYSLDGYVQYMSEDNTLKSFGNSELIQIHGRLNDPDNTINFGFGDEMDKHYQEIEEKDDNEYLKYIKSFQYLQNSNYKRVLDFIDGEKFQVYIMGHSCGLSDRILLNTIFEHANCVSIKVFYYQRPDGTDNYTEIVQNISRHFNKKKLMRDKIVNKSLCQPLLQDIRFEEK